MSRKVLIFGASLGGKRLHAVLRKDESVLAFIDNDPAKHGGTLIGKRILPTKEALKLEFDGIIIASQAYPQIGAQLVELGVPVEKIEVADISILRGDYELGTYKPVFVSIALVACILALLLWIFL